MNLTNVRTELTAALAGISGLHAYEWAKGSITPPAALVLLPESINYDQTYGRGQDQMQINVLVLVRMADERTAFNEISAYADGSGASSVKAALQSATYTSCDVVTVQTAEFDVVTVGGTQYLGATFGVFIAGHGS